MDIIDLQLYNPHSNSYNDTWKRVPSPFSSVNASANTDADAQCEQALEMKCFWIHERKNDDWC